MGRMVDVNKREVWLRRFRRFEAAGLSVARFCRQEQVSVATFYTWRRKLAAKSGCRGDHVSASSSPAAGGSANGFVPVRILPPTQVTRPAGVRVRLNNGVRLWLPGGDVETLRQVVRVVSQLPAGAPRADQTEDAAC